MRYKRSNTWSKKHILLIVILVLFAVVALLIMSSDKSQKTEISILIPNEGTTVFFDNKKEKVTSKNNELVMIKDALQGSHLILTHKEGHWPWSKAINVQSATTLSTFGLKQIPTIASIPRYTSHELGENETYVSIMEYISNTNGSNKTSFNKNTKIEKMDENISISWIGEADKLPKYFCNPNCTETFNLLPENREIRNVAFYPKRDDLVIFAAENRVYVIEADKRDIQNIQPLYESTNNKPDFAISIDNNVYIKDADKLFLITL